MKKELHPGVVIGIVAVLLAGVIAFFVFGSGGGGQKVDIDKLDPKVLADEDVPKPGQPGYKQRTTDP